MVKREDQEKRAESDGLRRTNKNQIRRKSNGIPRSNSLIPESMKKEDVDLYGLMDLPPDIVSDILSRITMKDLCVCQVVCKNWFGSLTKEPHLLDMQLRRALFQPPPQGMLLDDFCNTNLFLALFRNRQKIVVMRDVERSYQ